MQAKRQLLEVNIEQQIGSKLGKECIKAVYSHPAYLTYMQNKVKLVAQSCLTLCDLIDCSLPGSSVHGIFQARILEWVAISFSRGSSQPRDGTQVSSIAGRRFTVRATREVEYIMWNAGLDEAQAGIKVAGEISTTSDIQMIPL